jgi:hypothetical protein
MMGRRSFLAASLLVSSLLAAACASSAASMAGAPSLRLRGGSAGIDNSFDGTLDTLVSSLPNQRSPGGGGVLEGGSHRLEASSGLDVSSYNTLIGACATSAISSEVVEQVLRALHIMRDTRVSCDTQAYSALLRTCAQATGGSGGLEEGIAALHALRGMGVRPDAACYNTLIGSCAAVALGNDGLSLAGEVLMSMRNASTSVKLLQADVNALVQSATDASGIAGAVAKGATLLDEMVEEGWTPDAMTCNALLEACSDMCSSRGMLSQAMDALGSARGMYTAEAAPYNMLMDALCEASLSGLRYGLQVAETMKRSGVEVDEDMIHLLVTECSATAMGSGALGCARSLLTAALDSGISASALNPHKLLSTYAEVCGEGGAIEIGIALLKLLREVGGKPRLESYACVLEAACSLSLGEGVLARSVQLIKTVRDKGVHPLDATMSELTEACGLAGGPGGALWQAMDVIQEMRLSGERPSMSDVKGLLSAVAKVSEAEGALDTGLLLVQMSNGRDAPVPARVCNELVLACAKCVGDGGSALQSSNVSPEGGAGGLVGLGLAALNVIDEGGLDPDADAIGLAVRILVAGSGAGGVSMLRLGREVLHCMVEAGLTPSDQAVASFLRACSSADPIKGLTMAVDVIEGSDALSEAGGGGAVAGIYSSLLTTCVHSAVGESPLKQGLLAVEALLSRGHALPPNSLNLLLSSAARACGGSSAISPAVNVGMPSPHQNLNPKP